MWLLLPSRTSAKIQEIDPDVHIWIAFGMGKNFQHLSFNAIHESLGKSKARTLPMFHAFSGCDTTSSFQGRGKKRALEAWNAYPELSQTFQDVSSNKFKNMAIDSAAFKVVERFVVVLYGKTVLRQV